MAVTEYKFPGTAANVANGGYAEWSIPDYAKTDDSNSTVTAPSRKNNSDYLTLTNFGFTSSDIPDGATINGIEFVINRSHGEADNVYDVLLYLLKNGTQHGSNLASATKWTTSFTDATYGGATNLCGGSWTQADILDADFGFQLSIKATTNPESGKTSKVDYGKLRVYYTEGAGGVTIPVFMYHYMHH
jgi:hypothetical protein